MTSPGSEAESAPPPSDSVSPLPKSLIATVIKRLRGDRPVRRTLPGDGRLHIDRQLPYICLYRRPEEGPDLGTETLVTATASYLIGPGSVDQRPGLAQLVDALCEQLSEIFGALLVIEIRTTSFDRGGSIRVRMPDDVGLPGFGEHVRRSLQVTAREFELSDGVGLRLGKTDNDAATIMTAARARELRTTMITVEIAPFYRDPESGVVYPEVLRKLRKSLWHALSRSVHRFSCSYTNRCPVNYHMMGRRAVVKAVREADRQLADASESFDFLLQVTPTNSESCWQAFSDSGFDRAPSFRYRPLPWDPVHIKRQIWAAPVDQIEDPTLGEIFRQQQDELDRQVNLIVDRETPRFVLGASQIFGEVRPALVELANDLLKRYPSTAAGPDKDGINAQEFAAQAEAEIAYYREQWDGFEATVEIRSDVARGLLVSRGRLFIGEGTVISKSRVEALLHHEIGTHILTNANGKLQGFRLLGVGLAGYDPFQEGIAVLSEYLCGGLTAARLRLLAARVIGVHAMLNGASFVDLFGQLNGELGFEPRTAFTTTVRIFRGGGLTKDAAYLQGLVEILDYVASGRPIETLFVGKFAAAHLGVITELLQREVLRPPRLLPRYLQVDKYKSRLARLSAGVQVIDLLDE